MLALHDVGKSYGHLSVLRRVSINFERGTWTSLFGPNGVGKSTLLRIIAGAESADNGQLLRSADIKTTAYVPQKYRESLLPWASVRENILLPLRIKGLSRAAQELQLRQALSDFKFDLALDQPLHQLSGGQAQAVAILRAAIIQPDILILDEPFSALDYYWQRAATEGLKRLQHEHRCIVVSIFHSLEQSVDLSDRLVFLRRGSDATLDTLETRLPAMNQTLTLERARVLAEHAMRAPERQLRASGSYAVRNV